MATNKAFDSTNLRTALAVLFAVIIVGSAGLFYFGLTEAQKYSVEVNHRLIDADASSEQLQGLQQLGSQIANNESLLSKADLIFANADNYEAQALSDIKNYANQTGLQLGATQFSDAVATGEQSVNVEFKKPVQYSQLLRFMALVEGNLPKMQIASIELAHAANGGADDIDVQSLIIKVFVK